MTKSQAPITISPESVSTTKPVMDVLTGNEMIGYARVSTLEQNLDLQVDALTKVGCRPIYQEKLSGSLTNRPELERCMNYLRKGDVLVVWRLDRLGRGIKNLIEIVNQLKNRGIGFKSIQENIDTTTATGELIFHIFASLAQFERRLIQERTKAGIEAAYARGKVGGRPLKLSLPDRVKLEKMYLEKSLSIRDLCKLFGISTRTLYKTLKLTKEKSLNIPDIPNNSSSIK